MQIAEAIIENSFKITGRGVVIELRHSENGLAKDTELTSIASGLQWKIIARVLFDHAVNEQKIFECECVEYASFFSFENPEKLEESISNIKERERNRIFQYFLMPIGHEDKPVENEQLIITTF